MAMAMVASKFLVKVRTRIVENVSPALKLTEEPSLARSFEISSAVRFIVASLRSPAVRLARPSLSKVS